MPRVYLATPHEIGRRLRETARGRGDTIIYENHTWSPRALVAGTTGRILESWRFSEERVLEVFEGA